MKLINKYPPLSIMIKPNSGDCNLNCAYCFYKYEVSQRKKKITSFMDIILMKNIIDKINSYPANEKHVVFQGGEPLLRGYQFYEEIFNYSKNLNINYSIQTNGILLDKKYCALFKKYHVLIGLSLDGDETNNILRKTKENKSSFSLTYKAMKLLQKENIPHNCLIVINKENIKHIKDIFNFFVINKEKYLQFIPCLSNRSDKYSLDDKLYGEYLINVFNCYYESYKNGNYVSIRNMDNYLNLVNHIEAEQCGMNGRCSLQFVIESNGDIYPCDFYCLDKYFLGNIKNTDFIKLLDNKTLYNFLKKEETPKKCQKCEYYQLCKGGCKRENEDFNRCLGTKQFFKTSLKKLDIMFKR